MKKGVIGFLLFALAYGIYLLFTQVLFGDDNLVQVKGELSTRYNFTETDHGGVKPTEYAFLSFMLKKDPRFYILKLNIDDVADGFRILNGVELSLTKADEITVWIKKSGLTQARPKVYKIDADGTVVFELPHKPSNNTASFTLMACLGLCFVAIYGLSRYQGHWTKFIRISTRLAGKT